MLGSSPRWSPGDRAEFRQPSRPGDWMPCAAQATQQAAWYNQAPYNAKGCARRSQHPRLAQGKSMITGKISRCSPGPPTIFLVPSKLVRRRYPVPQVLGALSHGVLKAPLGWGGCRRASPSLGSLVAAPPRTAERAPGRRKAGQAALAAYGLLSGCGLIPECVCTEVRGPAAMAANEPRDGQRGGDRTTPNRLARPSTPVRQRAKRLRHRISAPLTYWGQNMVGAALGQREILRISDLARKPRRGC